MAKRKKQKKPQPIKNLPDNLKNSGAPRKFDETAIDNLLALIALGTDWKNAAMQLGISREHMHRELIRGAQKKDAYCIALYQRFVKAISSMEINDLMVIQQATKGRKAVYEKQVTVEEVIDPNTGNKIELKKERYVKVQDAIDPDWRAAAWRLERKFPYKWSQLQRIEVDPIKQIEEKPVEDIGKIEDQLMKWAKQREQKLKFNEMAKDIIDAEIVKDKDE